MLKLYKYLKPYYLYVAVVLILVFFQTLCDIYLPTLMSEIIDKGVMKADITYIVKIGSYMLLVSLTGVLLAVAANFLSSQTSVGFATTIREKLFTKIESFSLFEFDKFGTSTLITRTTNDTNQIQMVTMIILRMLVGAPMMAIGGVIMAYHQDRNLTLILLAILPLIFLTIWLIASKALPLFRVVQKKVDRLNLVLREKLTGIRVIRAFNRTEYESERFDKANFDLTNNFIKINRIMAFLMPSVMFMMNISVVTILWFGIHRIDQGQMQMGSLVAFTQYAMQIMFSLVMFSIVFVMVPRAQAAALRINEVLETEPSIVDTEVNDNTQTNLYSNNISGAKGKIEFRNVTFRYRGAENPAIDNISFTINPGQTTAIIGSTGAGKSTIVNLIMRFYEPESGQILIDGVEIRNMTQQQLRSKIGLVPQKAVLFSGTIKDNICFGVQNASDEDIFKAASIAQASDFIEQMDGGYLYEISEGGTNVSGGQKQRLSIARAVAKKSDIYIFDDSFSALDFKTDAKLREALKDATRHSTVIIIAQRVGTVMNADQIIVLDDGRIQGIGKHEELIQNCDVYREIVQSQV